MAVEEPFISLSRLRLLLVPVGSVDPQSFHEWSQYIKAIDRVPLCDIPEDRGGRTRFMPTQLATGHLLLSFEILRPGTRITDTSLIRLSQWPMGVIGIAHASSADQLATLGADFKAQMEEFLPPDAFAPLATHCLAFQEASSRFILDTKDAFAGVVVIPHDMGNKQLYLATLVAELCSAILAGFSDIATTLESEHGNEALNTSLFARNTNLGLQPDPSFPSQSDVSSSRTLSPTGFRNSSSQSTSPEPTTADRRRSSTKILSSSRHQTSGASAVHFHARLYRLLADLYLLSGRITDASIWYSQAVESFKASGDNTWHAGALEGLCTCLVLEAWTAMTSTSDTPKSDIYADLWSKLTVAISLYGRLESPNGATSHDYEQASFLYAECVLRQAKLALAVWLSEGWSSKALELLINGIPSNVGPFSEASRISLTEKSGLSCSHIAGILAQAHGPYILHLKPQDQLKTLGMQASMYAVLGLDRKCAFITREILGVLMDLLACSREIDNQATMEEESSPYLEKHTLGQRSVESREGNASVVNLISRIGEAYGVDFSYLPIDEAQFENKTQVALETRSSGWPELQLGLIREVIAIAEALPEHMSVAQFALSTLWKMQQFLDRDEQQFLYTSALRAIAIAKRRGDSRLLSFWLDCPLLDVTLGPTLTTLLALPNIKADSGVPGIAGPFLYNPNQLSQSKKHLLVQKEATEFHLTFRNPYSIPCELPNMTLSTSGAAFQPHQTGAILPPLSHHTIRLRGIPLEPGPLTVRGCFVRLPGSSITEIIVQNQAGVKHRSYSKPQRLSSETDPAQILPEGPSFWVECEVAPAQPLLHVKSTSLIHGSAMLFDGEITTLRLTLENISDIGVGFLQLLFVDTIQEAAEQELLSEGLISELEAYELDYELKSRPVFTSSGDYDSVRMGPGESKIISIDCLGKSGCAFGSIQVMYGRAAEENRSLYSRRLDIPVLMTIYRALEIKSLEIVPYSAGLSSAANSRQLSIPEGQNPSEWCLLVLQVENPHTAPFQLIVEFQKSGKSIITVSPGSTASALLPIKRIWLSEERSAAPIPAPSGRQFILRSPATSKGNERERELFWFREELFSSLRAQWRDLSGERSGELVMRGHRLTRETLSILRLEDTRIRTWILSEPDGSHAEETEQHAEVPVNKFLYIKTRIDGRGGASERPLTLSLSVDLTDFILLEGSSDPTHFRITETKGWWTDLRPLCFISSGRFRFQVIVSEEMTGKVVNQLSLTVNARDHIPKAATSS